MNVEVRVSCAIHIDSECNMQVPKSLVVAVVAAHLETRQFRLPFESLAVQAAHSLTRPCRHPTAVEQECSYSQPYQVQGEHR